MEPTMWALLTAIIGLATAMVGFAAKFLRRRPASAHDREVYNLLSSLLPENALQGFLRRAGAAGVIDTAFAANLEDWITTAGYANNCFVDRKIERAKRKLMGAIWEVLSYTVEKGFSAVNHPDVANLRQDVTGEEGVTPWDYAVIRRELETARVGSTRFITCSSENRSDGSSYERPTP